MGNLLNRVGRCVLYEMSTGWSKTARKFTGRSNFLLRFLPHCELERSARRWHVSEMDGDPGRVGGVESKPPFPPRTSRAVGLGRATACRYISILRLVPPMKRR